MKSTIDGLIKNKKGQSNFLFIVLLFEELVVEINFGTMAAAVLIVGRIFDYVLENVHQPGYSLSTVLQAT